MSGIEHLLADAAPWLHRYGYAAVAVGVMAEGVGIPLPGALLMGGAALLAGRGEMSVGGVLLTAWLAAVAGDNLGYWIGRHGGRRLLLRAGVSRRRLHRFDGFVRRFGVWLVLLGRFLDGTRQLNALVAGSAHLPWRRFFSADLVGSGAWAGFWVLGLSSLDRHGATLHRLLLEVNPWIALALLAGALGGAWYLFRRAASGGGPAHFGDKAPIPKGRAAGVAPGGGPVR